MSQVIDTLYEPLLTSSGDLVVSADSSQTATYDAVGVTSQSNYVFELWSPGGQQIADLSPYLRTRHFTVTRNRPEIVDLSFDLGQMESVAASLGTTVRNLFGPGFNEIRIKRGQRYLVGSQVQFFYPSLTGDQRTLQIRAVGFLELLKDRYLYPMDGASLTQTNQDIGQIMWNFINLTQSRTNGSFGFTLGVIQPSRTITDTWQPHATNIRDILIALTKRYDSVDLSFTPDKIFNVSYPMGQDKTELRFSLPGNIKDLRLPVDASQLATLVFARGSGNGSDQQLVPSWPAGSTSEQQTYRLREVVLDFPAVTIAQALQEKAREHHRKNNIPTVIPEITLDGNQEPFLGSYWIGDRVPFSIDANQGSAFAALDGQMWRINEIDVTVDENDAETITLKVGLY